MIYYVIFKKYIIIIFSENINIVPDDEILIIWNFSEIEMIALRVLLY